MFFLAKSGAQVSHDCACGAGTTDGAAGERLAIIADDNCFGFETPVRKQYVGGDHHAARSRRFRDPVIGGVETVRYDMPGDQRMVGHTKARIADQHDGHTPAPGDFVNLLLYRARIGINQYAGRRDARRGGGEP